MILSFASLNPESELEKRGKQKYLAHIRRIGLFDHKDQKLQTVMALTFAALTLFSCVEKEKVEVAYFEFLSCLLEEQYELKNFLPPGKVEDCHLDFSTGWNYESALKESLQLVYNNSFFYEAWSQKDFNNCYVIAEKVLFLKLSPNALLAIKNHVKDL